MEKWKSWAIGICATWVLLAFIAVMYRHSSFVFSKAFEPYIVNKLMDAALFTWLDTTLLTGLLAIGAALIGAYSLHRSTQKQIEQNQLSALKLIYVHASIMCDQLHANLRISAYHTEQFIQSAQGLSIVDADLTWLAVCTSRHIHDLSESDRINKDRYNVIYLRTSYLRELLQHTITQLESGTFDSVLSSGFLPKELLEDLKKRELKISDAGEFDNLFKWSKRVDPVVFADYL